MQVSLIETLLKTANLPEKNKEKIDIDMFEYSYDEAQECINMLNENQVDAISSGNNYSQTDINKKLKKEI